ncbi:MAG: ceramidase domain-containing protein [Alphaproteobacteria bacterium]|nr:ceramidase domain-containing protein [Alphaproteobacteria bacterium]
MTTKTHLARILLIILPVAAVVAAIALGPLPQAPEYHRFADARSLLGIPNFTNVATNAAFLLAGGLGLNLCLRRPVPGAVLAWMVFFAGFVLVAFGSAYYHLDPGNRGLVFDRLAMAIAFAGAYVALIGDHVAPRAERVLLGPALVLGLASVLYWGWVDDLAFYFAVQGTVFLSALVILSCCRFPAGQKRFLLWAGAAYALAVVFEQLDRPVFAWSGGAVGGHALKHLAAAASAYVIYRMLRARLRPGAAD